MHVDTVLPDCGDDYPLDSPVGGEFYSLIKVIWTSDSIMNFEEENYIFITETGRDTVKHKVLVLTVGCTSRNKIKYVFQRI